jgi:hypothetical protein
MGMTLVTANVGDFLKLARARDVHPGIVLLEDDALPRAEQLRLLRVAAAAIAQLGDLLNRLVWVAADGSTRVGGHPSAVRPAAPRARWLLKARKPDVLGGWSQGQRREPARSGR